MKELVVKRRNFIANRVVISQLTLIILTNLFTSLIILLKIEEAIIPYWYLYLLIIPIASGTFGFIKRKKLYFEYHWIITLIPILVPWLSITVFVGVVVDNFLGIGKTLAVSLVVSIYYVLGYGIARILRFKRVQKKFKKKAKLGRDRFRINLFLLVTIPSLIYIAFSITYGLYLLQYFMKLNNIGGIYIEHYGVFRNCLQCTSAVFFMLSGIGIVISMVLNFIMLINLTNTKGYSVEQDPPNRLILAFLCSTVIVMCICWILAEFFIPPIPIGKKGGSSGAARVGRASGSGGNGTFKRDKVKYEKMADIYKRYEMIDKEWDKKSLL
ncbi:MAG: hypothetical protein ACFFG0_11600 [Candidatus Thorarchaeota archaeon]